MEKGGRTRCDGVIFGGKGRRQTEGYGLLWPDGEWHKDVLQWGNEDDRGKRGQRFREVGGVMNVFDKGGPKRRARELGGGMW